MLRCVSLFSGAGGLDLGLQEAGFKVEFATDIEPLCSETYTHRDNFGPEAAFYCGSVSEVTRDLIEKHTGSSMEGLDLMVGGPPCPPYSKSRFYRVDKPRGIDDPVGDETLRGYIRLLGELRPRAFLFENVAGFAYAVHRDALDVLEEEARQLGYSTSQKVLNAADYGVPQIRERFFMVGLRGSRQFQFPAQTHFDPGRDNGSLFSGVAPQWRTAGDVLADIDTDENGDDAGHFAGGRYHELLRQIPPGDNYLYFTEKRGHPQPQFKWRSRYWSFLLKLSPSKPSWTIQARRSNNMGPFHWRSRILRIAEVKRLQTFPDTWYLAGTTEQQWRLVGNAVPPQLAAVLGRAIRDQLDGMR